MKNLKLTIILICNLLFALSNVQAQAPEKINYQAVARNLAGNPLVNQAVGLEFNIRQGSPTGAVVYSETHTGVSTNQFGLFTAEIGGGTVNSGIFSAINWGLSSFYLQVTIDGNILPATQLLSVPFALYAKESANGPAGLPGKNSLSLSTPYTGPACINGGTQVDAGLDDNNDGTLQPLEIDYTYIVCNGTDGTNGTNGTNGLPGTNGVDGVSIDSTINNNDGTFSIYYSNGTSFTTSDLTGPAGTSGTTYFAGNGISLSGDTITNLGDLDNNPTNELQLLSVSNDTIFLSNGGFAPLPSAGGFWTQLGGSIHNNNIGKVGIGTSTPIHQLSVASNDSVVASFLGTNPSVSAIVVANVNPNAATGIVFFNGTDTTSYIFLNPTTNTLAIRNNSVNGNIQISTDSVLVNQGLILVNQAQNSIYNEADTIYNYSPSGKIINVNQGMFLTDSLYVLGNNAANVNWVLANDGFGQAKWTDPSTIVGSVGDNWGSQVVIHDTTLTGTGIAGTPLSVNPNIIPTQTSQLTNNSGFITSPNDGDTSITNELQVLSFNNDTLYLSNGNAVYLPPAAGDSWGSDSVITSGANISGSGTSANPLMVFDNDTSATNEIQTLSLVGDTLSISGGNNVNLSTLSGTTYTAGTGINLTGDSITNTAPDQTVVITGGGTTSVTSAYPSFIVTTNDNDTSATNELQNLSVTTTPGVVTLGISGGNTINFSVDDSPTNELITSFGVNGTSDSLVIVEAGNTWNVPLTSFSAAGKWSENAGDLYPTTLTNNVGIGTATPVSKLDVLNNTLNSGVNISSTGALAGNLYGMQVSSSNGIVSNKYGIVSTASGADGNQYGLNGIASGAGTGTTYAVYGQNTATNTGNAFAGSFENTSSAAANKYGVYGVVAANGGQQYGVAGSVTGGGTGVTYGVSGSNSTSSTGDSYGGYFSNINASSTSNSYGIFTQSISTNNNTKYGILASTNGGSVSATKYAVYGAAGGSGTVNYGIYGTANGATTNYAGYFNQGDVLINNTLILPTGASTGFVLTSDLVGNASWQPAAASGAWTSNGTQTFLNSNNDYVGIGTNNPLSKLHILGTSDPLEVVLENGGGAFKTGYSVKTGAGQSWFMGKELTPNFVIKDETAGQVRFQIETSGNVGIGTTAPLANLHVEGFNAFLRLQSTQNTPAANSIIEFGNTIAGTFDSKGSIGNPGSGDHIEYDAATFHRFTTNGNERMRLTNAGELGIGTFAPESMLHVALPNAANHKAFQLGHGNQPTLEWLFKVDEFSLFSIANENNGTELTAMIIDANNGNVGIGTTIANSKLDVQTADNNVHAFSSIHSGTNAHAGYFKINNATNNLNAVNATTNGAGAAINASNTYAGANAIRDGIYVTVIGAGGAGTVNKAGYFSASNASNNYAAIFDQGNVGIGTPAPSAKLHLEGSLRLNNLSGTAPAVGSVLTSIDAAGNAEWAPPSGAANAWNLTGNAGTNATTDFIGTTDNVALNFRVNNTTAGKIDSAAANSFFGFLAGASTTGNNNTAIGYQAFLSNTSGTYNTAIGANALKINNIGNQNTAIGAASLQNNTGNNNTATGYATLQNNTGSWNTATGHSALLSNTTGNSNTANGFEALQNNTTGNQNTAVGQTSLYSNTTGNYNTALGHYALANNTTAGMNTAIGKSALYTQAYSNGGTPWESDNVAIGYEALYTNNPTSTINGNSNTAVGNFALRNNTVGNNNTANGYNSLYTNTTGSSNTANGMYTLYANTSGDNNTAIGYQSLWSNTTGTANTAVGLNALRMNTIGTQNTAIGVAALGFSTGSYNTATGYSALQNNTGTYNTANGHGALNSNTTGNNNTATGMAALFFNTIGSDNTANGRYALSSNIDGNFNVATGNNALYSNTSGGRNTAIGQYALYLNSTGNFNTALGDNALTNTTGGNNTGIGQFSGSNNTTGSSNTFLGKSADATVNNLTNATAVGANAVVSQSNSLILGNAANVGIGTSAPTAKLDVNGTIVISGANTNELNRAQTGTANLVPIAYGSVSSGATIANAGTGNWTVTAGGAGQYTITVTGETFVGSSHIMSGTMNGTYGFISLIAFTNNILVQTTNTGGANQNAAFSFVVYKP